VKMNNTKNEPSSSSSTCIAEETYRAPYSRGSSLEDRCTRNSEYGKAPPTNLEAASIGTETFRAHVSDTRNSTLEKIPEILGATWNQIMPELKLEQIVLPMKVL
ncbi:myosin-2-like, partial [Trifolium medium]|nr:myosin-2-like [Trifolium medium]